MCSENNEAADLSAKIEELTRRDKVKDEFISHVSHELRTALMCIKMSVSNAQDGLCGPVEEALKKALLIADRNVERSLNILNEMLDVARIHAGKLKLNRAFFDPADILSHIVLSFKDEAIKKGITLAHSWDAPRAKVLMDPHRISQVVSNLLSNALKFTPDGGRVTARGVLLDKTGRKFSGISKGPIPDGTSFAIEVSDTGCGIDAEHLDKIFDRFKQAPARSRSGELGLGLGLSISKDIVVLHGCRIWAESKKGIGSKFTFTLPAGEGEGAFREALAERIQTATSQNHPLSLLLFKITGGVKKPGSEGDRVAAKTKTHEILEASIKQMLRRQNDLVLWCDSSRLAVIMPETTPDAAKSVSSRIVAAIDELKEKMSGKLKIGSYTVGVAAFPFDGDGVDDLLTAAAHS